MRINSAKDLDVYKKGYDLPGPFLISAARPTSDFRPPTSDL